MHGPQALAKTTAPMRSRSASSPSRSMVARTRSEPGVTISLVRAVRPWSAAARAMLAAREMSSYDELVHEPTRAALISMGQPSLTASSPSADTGRARSGVWGPLMSGSRVDKSMRTTSSKKRSGSASTSGSAVSNPAMPSAASAMASRPVERRYRPMASS